MPAARRKLIVGNWKMNPSSLADAHTLAGLVRDSVTISEGVDVVVCPPTIWLTTIREALRGSAIDVGAQTMHWEASGAHTGETSPAMLAGERGFPVATHVVIGHSERRQSEGETDEKVSRKVAAALEYGLVPIAAIGEGLDQRRDGIAETVIGGQLEAALSRVPALAGRRLAIAYEPVWAIGTGIAASAADAQAAATRIRDQLRERFGADAEGIPILYGGSVTSENADDFFARSEIDGALVGGASLRADEFSAIVAAAAAAA